MASSRKPTCSRNAANTCVAGGGHSMCKGRAFAQKEALVFTAAFISMWDMEPVGGGAWKLPRFKPATGVYTTNDDIRVSVSRRKGLPEA